MYNYADDSTVDFFHSHVDISKTKPQEGYNIVLNWFDEKYMQANASKFPSTTYRQRRSVSDVA